MDLFDFDYHTFSTKYPENPTRMQLGNSYMYTATPTAPDQRIITLYFSSMKMYTDPLTGVPDFTTNPAINFNRLEKFYQDHRQHVSFNYQHVVYGLLVVKFNKALETPKAGLHGLMPDFSVELLEIP